MKVNKKWTVFIMIAVTVLFLSACSAQDGIFHTYLVNPLAFSIHGLANLFGGSFGLGIIVVTLIIRLLLMPLMLKQYQSQRNMKIKMEAMKPELDVIQKKLKETKDPTAQRELQQEMMGLYKKHNFNPLSMGCLPLLIQMPILMGFFYAIRGSAEIASHSFLWFSLGQPDIWLTAAAGIVYYLQFKVSLNNMSTDQQKQMKMMGWLSPLMIVMVSFNAPAALPLYWTVSGVFLILQTYIGMKLYPPVVPKPNQEVTPEKA